MLDAEGGDTRIVDAGTHDTALRQELAQGLHVAAPFGEQDQ